MASVKLYDLDALYMVHGLYADKALNKLGQKLDVYSALLDGFLNNITRTVPKLRQNMKVNNLSALAGDLKDLRVDLADVFALDLLEAANTMYEAAEQGNAKKCQVMLENLVNALQAMFADIKECRTQSEIENEEAVLKAAASVSIGASMVNSKYSTVPKAKFVELHKRIDLKLLDKAMNLAKIQRGLGYDSVINGMLDRIMNMLNVGRPKDALDVTERLLEALGAEVPPRESEKFYILAVGNADFTESVAFAVDNADSRVAAAADVKAAIEIIKEPLVPDMLLIGGETAEVLANLAELRKNRRVLDAAFAVALSAVSPADIKTAASNGVAKILTLPIELIPFRQAMRQLRGTLGK